MTVSSSTLRRLAALRLSPKAMQEVLSILAEAQADDEDRLAKQRERTRRSRANNVTVTLQERDGNSDTSSQKESPPHPQKKNIYTPTEAKASVPPKPKHGTRLPEGWNPSEENWNWAKAKLGLADDALRFETSAFRDHFWASARANASKRNWDLAWKNWMREASRRASRLPLMTARKNGAGWYIKPDTAEWDAWKRYGIKHSVGDIIYGMKVAEEKGTEFHVKDRWPPR